MDIVGYAAVNVYIAQGYTVIKPKKKISQTF